MTLYSLTDEQFEQLQAEYQRIQAEEQQTETDEGKSLCNLMHTFEDAATRADFLSLLIGAVSSDASAHKIAHVCFRMGRAFERLWGDRAGPLNPADYHNLSLDDLT